jgi:hypothetical protein
VLWDFLKQAMEQHNGVIKKHNEIVSKGADEIVSKGGEIYSTLEHDDVLHIFAFCIAVFLEPISKLPEEDNEAGKLNEAKEVLWMIFPSDEDPTLPLDAGKEAFNQPAPQEASQAAPVLRRRFRSVRAARPQYSLRESDGGSAPTANRSAESFHTYSGSTAFSNFEIGSTQPGRIAPRRWAYDR